MTKKPKVLFFDIETGGVGGLRADLGYVICFGYKFLGDKKATCLRISDFGGKGWPNNCQDDTELLKAANKVMQEADLLVAHFGEFFDRPFLESRLLHAGLEPLPPLRLADTCLIARKKLKLSSNRLDNLAKFLKCKTRKMQKGDGWPKWWFGAMRGDKKSISDMAKYCIVDVECLEEIFLKMRHLIPGKYLLNMAIGQERNVCVACGSDVQYRGSYYSEKKEFRRFACKNQKCRRWDHDTRAIASAPKKQ